VRDNCIEQYLQVQQTVTGILVQPDRPETSDCGLAVKQPLGIGVWPCGTVGYSDSGGHLRHGVVEQHRTLMQDHNPVDQGFHVSYLMSGNNKDLVIVKRFRNQTAEQPLGRNIQAIGGFVQNQQLGSTGKAEREQELLLLSKGKFDEFAVSRNVELSQIAFKLIMSKVWIKRCDYIFEFPIGDTRHI